MKSENRDYIFDGAIVPALFKLSIPVYIGHMVQFIYNLVDTYWVSNIDLNDPSYVGGIGLIFPIFIIIFAITSGISVGVSSLVSKAVGRKDDETLAKVMETSLILAVSLAIVLIPLAYLFSDKIIGILAQESPDFYKRAHEYFIYTLPAFAFIFIQSAFMGILQGEGSMKLVMKISLLGTLINIILDPILIMGFDMGVKGAAIATSVSAGVSTTYLIIITFRKRQNKSIKLKVANIDFTVLKEILNVGVLQSFSILAMAIQIILINDFLMSINPHSLTAISIFFRLDQISMMPAFAFGAATITMVGQNLGRKNCLRVEQIMNRVFTVGAAVVFVACAVVFVFAPMIYPYFSSDQEVIAMATTFTHIAAFNSVFALFGITGRSFFQALGFSKTAFMITLLRTLILCVPLMYWLNYQFELGIYSVSVAMVVSSFISSLVSVIIVKSQCKKLIAECDIR